MGKDQTPEQLGREAGEAIANAIADNLEAVIMRLADSIAELKIEQAKLREDLNVCADFAMDLMRDLQEHKRRLHGG